MNALRREHRALQLLDNVAFPDADNDAVLWYVKRGADPQTTLMIAVNLDPHRPQETMVDVPLALLGVDEHTPFEVEDLLSGERYTWRGRHAYVRLDPAVRVGQVFRLQAASATA